MFHPDKHTDESNKEAATTQFRAINEAYEGKQGDSARCLRPHVHERLTPRAGQVDEHRLEAVLSNPGKRTIYDLYGVQGLKAGYEVGPKLKSPEEVTARSA